MSTQRINKNAPCWGQKFGHNFPYTGSDCLTCGMNQAVLSGHAPKKIQQNTIAASLNRFEQRRQPTGIHSELHELIAKMIKEFHEPYPYLTIHGKKVSTFGYYLGKLKKVPTSLLYQWTSEIRQSPDVRSPSKIFWWKYKKWKGEK